MGSCVYFNLGFYYSLKFSTLDEMVIEEINNHFSWADYSIFCLMLLIPSLIGVYYWRKKGSGDYLTANKNMSVFPITMSLAAR